MYLLFEMVILLGIPPTLACPSMGTSLRGFHNGASAVMFNVPERYIFISLIPDPQTRVHH